MNKILREKIQEALSSVLPITLIVLVLSMTITPMLVGTLVLFLAGAVLLIVGMAFFSLGTDVSMTPMGEGIGAQLPKTKNLAVVIAITLLIGILITIAEPDLQVLAGQVPSIPNSMLIWTVAVGVGLFFVLALLRTIFKIRLSLLLILFYIAIFSFSAFVPNEFVSVAFDSGGVTTGPITVPFIMALGVGLASIRGRMTASAWSHCAASAPCLRSCCSAFFIRAAMLVIRRSQFRSSRTPARSQRNLSMRCRTTYARSFPPCCRSLHSVRYFS